MARAKRIEGETDNTMSDKDSRKIAQIGGNIGPVKEIIAKDTEQYRQNKKEIKALNDENKAIREKLETLGVKKKSFMRSLSDCELSPEELEAQDDSYELCRESMGKSIGGQGDMFQDNAG